MSILIKRADAKFNANESSGLEHLVRATLPKPRPRPRPRPRPDNHKAKATNVGLKAKD